MGFLSISSAAFLASKTLKEIEFDFKKFCRDSSDIPFISINCGKMGGVDAELVDIKGTEVGLVSLGLAQWAIQE